MEVTVSSKSIYIKEDHKAIYMATITCACLVILMRRKKITPLQNYFLINIGERYFEGTKTIMEIVYNLTESMAALQKTTTYMDYLHLARRADRLTRPIKKQMIVNIMTAVMLDDEEDEMYCQPLSYVRFIMEDIGFRFFWSYYWLSRKAWIQSREIQKVRKLGDYDRALEIMQDALSRSDLAMQ